MVLEKKYSDELRQRAIQRVIERRKAEPNNRSILREVAAEYGIGEQSLRTWVKKLNDGTQRLDRAADPPALGRAEAAEHGEPQDGVVTRSLLQRIAELEEEVRVLRADNEALKRASAIFAAELVHSQQS